MLVILSDLHLNDGTTGAGLASEAMGLLADRIRDLAITASWRSDGTYRPLERIDLVLLGDTFDFLHSTRWQSRPEVRPWHDPRSPGFIDVVTTIANDILSQNQEVLNELRALTIDGEVAVPPMLRAARPAIDADFQPVMVRIHYMVGEHDWFFHLPGEHYDSMRRKLVDQLGLAQRADQPFAHDIVENDELLQVMRRHKVVARHGDLYDPLAFEGDRDTSSLTDALVIELSNRFGIDLERELANDLPDAALLALRQIDSVQPLLLAPAWIEGILERNCPQPAVRKRVKLLWDRLVDELLASDPVRRMDANSHGGAVDGLAQALRFGRRISGGWSAATWQWLQQMRGSANDSYACHAPSEPDFRNRRAKHIVYGHTHISEITPLDAIHAEGYELDQIYFNTGTWRRVFRQAQFTGGQTEFIPFDMMTYLAFFQNDERKGRAYEAWSGALGYSPMQRRSYRIDGASSVPIAGPHFMSSPARTSAPAFVRRTPL
jgi:UDP-2,3-diacylglucosamine pyrophosphatase LpxH